MIEVGATCKLRACNCDVNATNTVDTHASINCDVYSQFIGGTVNVTGCVIGAQPHLEDSERVLYYFHTTSITPVVHLSSYNNCTEKNANVDKKMSFDASEHKLSDSTDSTNTQVKSTIAPLYQTKTARQANNATMLSSNNHLLDSISTRGSNDSAARNELTLNESTSQYFTSSEGYVYRFDGWYDYDDLVIIDNNAPSQSVQGKKSNNNNAFAKRNQDDAQLYLFNKENEQKSNKHQLQEESNGVSGGDKLIKMEIPDAWLELMYKDCGPCEIIYLCYRFKPWFRSPFHALQYLSAPCSQVCFSVYVCHRCLTPFYSEAHLQCHLEGYCTKYEESPPGELIYHDEESNRKVYYVDGALHLHYVRCLSLLGKCFIESKLLHNDVDIYELFVLTIPRDALPFIHDKCEQQNSHEKSKDWYLKDGCDCLEENEISAHVIYEDESAFRDAACTFDSAHWNGDVVAGYVSRIKHAPNHTLSCILVLPCFQRCRLGIFLLDMAYFLTRERQRQCGCVEYCGTLGGKVSRPLSPSGEALLLRYWRGKLETLLWRRAEQGLTNEFDGIDDLCSAMSLHAIHKDDLEFLLVNDHIAFYAHHEKSAVNRVVSLVFDHAKVYKNMGEMHKQSAVASTENSCSYNNNDQNSKNTINSIP